MLFFMNHIFLLCFQLFYNIGMRTQSHQRFRQNNNKHHRTRTLESQPRQGSSLKRPQSQQKLSKFINPFNSMNIRSLNHAEPVTQKNLLLIQNQGEDQGIAQATEQTTQTNSPSRRHRLVSNSKISPTKPYYANLRLSADRWMLYDYRTDGYKRGWKPAQSGQFTGIIRLLAVKIFTILHKTHPQLPHTYFKINPKYLKQQIQLAEQRKLSPKKKIGITVKLAICRAFDNNMAVNIVDLLYGLLMSAFDDIVEYAVVFIGYLCYCSMYGIQIKHYVHIEKVSEAASYANCFQQYCHQILFPQLQMTNSTFNPKQLTLQSCPNDICKLYLSLQQEDLFQKIIKCSQIKCKVKYQLGYHFWETRIVTFKNRRPDLHCEEKYQFFANWRGKRNFSIVCKNKELGILVVLQETRFGMANCDISTVQQWIKDIRKPITNAIKKNNLKLLTMFKVTSQDIQNHHKKNTKIQKSITYQ